MNFIEDFIEKCDDFNENDEGFTGKSEGFIEKTKTIQFLKKYGKKILSKSAFFPRKRPAIG